MRRVLLVCLLLSLAVFAQSPGSIGGSEGAQQVFNGLLYANAFGAWSVPQGDVGQFTWSNPNICTNLSGLTFTLFQVGLRITIVDADPTKTENTTVTAVNILPFQCSIVTAPLTNTHYSFRITSATFGLQESINYAKQQNITTSVYLTPSWARLGGITSMITAAQGNANIGIVDIRNMVYQSYAWNGSAYAKLGLSGLGINSIDNVPIGAIVPSTGAFTSLSSTSGALNGTIGATTPASGAFTTLSATGAISITGTDSGNQTVSGNKSFTGSNTFSNLNKTITVDGTVYPTSGVGIQSAITAQATAGGGTVYIPAGTYTASASITLASNVFIQCAPGWMSQINFVDDHSQGMIKFQAGTAGALGTGISNFGIEGCSIAMTGVSGRTGVYGLISVYNSSHFLIRKNQLGSPITAAQTNLSSSATCTYTENSSYFEESENTCANTQADGFHISRASNNFSVHDNWFLYTGDDEIGMVSIVTDDGTHTYGPVIFGDVYANHFNTNGGSTGGLSPNAAAVDCLGCANTQIHDNTANNIAGGCYVVSAITGNSNGNSTRYPYYVRDDHNTCNVSGLIGVINAAYSQIYCRGCRMDHNVSHVHSSDNFFTGTVGKDNQVDHNEGQGAAGRCINGIQTSTTEARAISELFTAFTDGTPARIGVSNVTVDHNQCYNATVASIDFEGENGVLNESGLILDTNEIYDPAANQRGIYAQNVSNSQFNHTTCTNMNNNACVTLSTGDSDVVDGGMMAVGTGASSGGTVFVGMTNSTVQNIFSRSAGIGAFVDGTGSNNLIRNNDLRSNSSGAVLIQDTTSGDIDNIKANFTGLRTQTIPDLSGTRALTVENTALRQQQVIADQGSICTNGELALSAGWQSSGSATVTAVQGTGQTCSWTITTGTTTAANPTITDTLTNALPSALTVCDITIYGGTHTAVAGESLRQTTLSATAPIFTANFTPTAGGTTYFITRSCGP